MKQQLHNFSSDPFAMHEMFIKDTLAERLVREGRLENDRIAEILDMSRDRVDMIYDQTYDMVLGASFRRLFPILLFIGALVGMYLGCK